MTSGQFTAIQSGEGGLRVGLPNGPKKTVKISIFIEDLSGYWVFFMRREAQLWVCLSEYIDIKSRVYQYTYIDLYICVCYGYGGGGVNLRLLRRLWVCVCMYKSL